MRKPSQICRFYVVLLLVAGSAILVSGCSEPTGGNPAESEDPTAEELIDTVSKEVSVFYPSADTIVEGRVVLDDGTDALLQALTMMFEQEALPSGGKITLPDAEVLGVQVEDGLATIDFCRDVLATGESASVQQVALVAIIYTATQFPEVERVAFTVEGQTDGTIDGKDVAAFWGDVTLRDMPWSAQVYTGTEPAKEATGQ